MGHPALAMTFVVRTFSDNRKPTVWLETPDRGCLLSGKVDAETARVLWVSLQATPGMECRHERHEVEMINSEEEKGAG